MAIAIAKTLLDTLDLRAGSVITEQEINALRMRWRPLSRRVQMGQIDVGDECNRIEHCLPMRVSDEQAHKGQKWLRAALMTRTGRLRNTRFVREQDVTEEHCHIVRTLDHFLLVAFTFKHNAMMTMAWPFPVYRAVAHDGQFFEYAAVPWTSGEATIGEVNSKGDWS